MPELKDNLFVDGGQDVPIPAHLNFGKFMFDRICRVGNEVAVHNATTGEDLTYKELTQQTVNLSVEFTNLGMGRGDVVVVGIDQRIQFVPTVLGVICAGATVSPAPMNTGKAILKHRLTLVPSAYLICTKSFWDLYREVLEEVKTSFKAIISFDDAAFSSVSIKSLISKHHDIERFTPAEVIGQQDAAVIYYSSGTTGMPKAIELTHVNCIMHSIPDDFKSFKTCFHLGHWGTNYIEFKTYKFLAGGKKIVYTENGKMAQNVAVWAKHKVEVVFFVPVFVYDLINTEEEVKKHDLSSIKIIYSRSSPLHAKTISKIKSMFSSAVEVYQGYGMTECGELTSEMRGTKGPKAGSVGRPSRGMTMKIVDINTGASLPTGQNGEICVRGSGVMKCYVGVEPSKYLDKDGFFKTGDLGYYDEDGYFYIIDRLKEIMIVEGHNVAPIELETILQLHPAIKETGVVGKPDDMAGELPTAFVVKKPGMEVTEQELKDYVKAEVSPCHFMELSGGVIFIPELPRNPRGKILRRRLREMLAEGNY